MDTRTKQERLKSRQKIKELRLRAEQESFRIRKDMFREIHKLNPKSRHYRMHARETDFEHYYARLRYTRPLGIIFIIGLWVLLFLFGGFKTSLGIVFSIFAIFATMGYIVQVISFTGMEKRVLKPIGNLKKGMDAIAEGNYDVTVDTAGAAPGVHSLIQNFNDMARKLEENERLQAEYEDNRKQLITSISHDLKTPITSVLGYIEAVSATEQIPKKKLERYLRIIHNNVAYLNRLIDDLFLFSKLDMQKLSFEFADIPVSPFIADIMEEMSIELEEKQVPLFFRNQTDGTLYARVDAKRFHQIIRNIVDNACKYGDTGLEIRTRLYSDGNSVCLDLSNNGPVIPSDKLDYIFDRFYRLDEARTLDTSSTGLGLAIAKELIAAHGGRITAESEPGKGTCFTITLPAVDMGGKGS